MLEEARVGSLPTTTTNANGSPSLAPAIPELEEGNCYTHPKKNQGRDLVLSCQRAKLALEFRLVVEQLMLSKAYTHFFRNIVCSLTFFSNTGMILHLFLLNYLGFD